MSVTINAVGRLGRDAEIVNGKNGQFLSFSLAVDEYRNKQRETTWLNVIYNNTNIAEWLKKGRLVSISGTETVRLYQTKTGQTQIDRSVMAGFVEFVNAGSGQTQSNDAATTASSTETQAKAPLTTGTLRAPQATVKTTINVNPPTSSEIAKEEVDDDDLPF